MLAMSCCPKMAPPVSDLGNTQYTVIDDEPNFLTVNMLVCLLLFMLLC